MYLEEFRGFLRKRPVFTSNLIASAGTMLTLFFAYLFHFIMTRLLSPAVYGDLSILVGVFSVACVPAASISFALARELSVLEDKGMRARANFVFFKYLRVTALASSALFVLLAGAALLVFSSWATRVAAAALFLAIPANYAINVASARFQSKEEIVVLSAIGVAKELLKLAAAAALVVLGYELLGAASAFPIGYFIVFAALAVHLRRFGGGEPHAVSLRRSLVLLMLTSFAASTYQYLDLFSVRLFLGNASAGFYNVASVTSKVLVFVASGLVVVLLPKSARLSYATGQKALVKLIKGSLLFLVPVLAAFLLFGRQLLGFFFPASYAAAASAPFALLSVGMFSLAVFNILLTVMWSQRQEVFPLALMAAAVVLQSALLYFLVPSLRLEGAALATAVSSTVLAGAAAWKVWNSMRLSRPAGA